VEPSGFRALPRRLATLGGLLLLLVVSAAPAEGRLPAPKKLSARVHAGTVILRWAPVAHATSYRISRRELRSGPRRRLKRIARIRRRPAKSRGRSRITYVDRRARAGRAYGYRVTPLDRSGRPGRRSRLVRARLPQSQLPGSLPDQLPGETPPEPVGANLWIDTDGGSCARQATPGGYSDAAACGSFNAAYQAADPGDFVRVKGGTYGGQAPRYDAAKATNPTPVVIAGERGNAVELAGDLDLGEYSDATVRGANYLTVRRVTVRRSVTITSCGAAPACLVGPSSGSYGVRLETVQALASFAAGGGSDNGFFCGSCENFTMVGGKVGAPTYLPCHGDAHPEIQIYQGGGASSNEKRPTGLTFRGVEFRNWARCNGSEHTECLQAEPVDYLTLLGNRFYACDTITVHLQKDFIGASTTSPDGSAAPSHVVIKNNWFGESLDNTGGETFFSLQNDECTNCLIQNNSWTQPANFSAGAQLANTGTVVEGNLGPRPPCTDDIVFRRNVFGGGKCGSTDKSSTAHGFANDSSSSAMNLHISAGSAALNSMPGASVAQRAADDYDGETRPCGSAGDAGADERCP
jgi:hypothetical protein